MITTLTKKEHDFVMKDHVETLMRQGFMYSRYMEERFFLGDFPKETEHCYCISVIESIFEDTMMLKRTICAPSVGSCYENILMPALRFSKSGHQYRRSAVYPVIYEPSIGDIVTLPVHLMVSAAEHDKRLAVATNWKMVIVGIEHSSTCVYEYATPRNGSGLIPEKIKLCGVLLTVAPIEYPNDPFTFPALPMMHYILIKPAPEKEDESIDITGEQVCV